MFFSHLHGFDAEGLCPHFSPPRESLRGRRTEFLLHWQMVRLRIPICWNATTTDNQTLAESPWIDPFPSLVFVVFPRVWSVWPFCKIVQRGVAASVLDRDLAGSSYKRFIKDSLKPCRHAQRLATACNGLKVAVNSANWVNWVSNCEQFGSLKGCKGWQPGNRESREWWRLSSRPDLRSLRPGILHLHKPC